MARLLEEISWADAVLPLPDDAQWEAEVRRAVGQPAACYLYAAPSVWLRRGLLESAQVQFPHLGDALALLAILVTSQENACRYCYGAARSYLKLLGLRDAHIDAVEREVRVAGGDTREREALQFCRNLSRSNPRPSRESVDALANQGFTPIQIREMAAAVVGACIHNRYATFLAVPLDGLERVDRPWDFLLRPLIRWFGRRQRRLPPRRTPPPSGPLGVLPGLIADTELGPVLADMIEGSLGSAVLPRRTVAWMYLVVATALECHLCGAAAKSILVEEGLAPDRVDAVVHALAGAELDETERMLLPWVRETVHYETEVIQKRTHALAARVDPLVLIEAIGVASVANACARLSMLEQ